MIPRLVAMGCTAGGQAFLSFEDVGNPLKARDFQDKAMRSAALKALQRVHRLGVAHLDVKRRHFRKDGTGRVRLIDFSNSSPQAADFLKQKDLASFKQLVRNMQPSLFVA